MRHLPKAHRQRSTWRHVAKQLTEAAAGRADAIDVAHDRRDDDRSGEWLRPVRTFTHLGGDYSPLGGEFIPLCTAGNFVDAERPFLKLVLMKAISVRQPWAALIALGVKDIENRVWRTRYRGVILVHAGLGRSARTLADIAPFPRGRDHRRTGTALRAKGRHRRRGQYRRLR